MRVLVTGFEAFGGDAENTSSAVVVALTERWEEPDVELGTAILPVRFDGAPVSLAAAITQFEPDAVLCLGEAGGRSLLTPERRAGVLADARIPDNGGLQPRDEALDDGPAWLPTRLDADAMTAVIREAGVAAEPSADAGTFVCNATFRAALRDFAGPAAFLHVPAIRNSGTATTGAETDPIGGDAVTQQLSLDEVVHAVAAVIGSLPRLSRADA